MLTNIKSFFNIFPVMKQVITRFPVSFFLILTLTCISLLLVHKIEIISKDIIGYVYLIMGFGAVAHVSFKLFVESKNWSLRKYSVGLLIVTVIVIFYSIMLYDKLPSASVLFFSLALGASWMFSPYISRTSNEGSVWYFNYQTGVAIFFAAIAAIVFGGGISLLLLSVGYLFEIKIPSILYGDIWIVTWGVLFTSYVLSNISKTFDYEDESCGFPKGISFIANYILVPLMVAYIAVLYAYFIKIILQWELPKGNLGWMISAFGIIGIATKLIAYPISQTGTKFMILFDKYFYYSLILPVIMLFIVIFIRINEYGITEQRYAVVLLGVLFSLIIIFAIIKKEQFHIKHVPMIIAVLALLASYGPWSGVELSLNSQLQRFELLLNKYERFEDGKAVRSNRDVSFEDRKALSSIADYLVRNKWRKKQVIPLFESILTNQDQTEINTNTSSGRKILALLNVEYVGYWRKSIRKEKTQLFSYRNHHNLKKKMVDVSGYDFIGRQQLYLYNKNEVTQQFSFKRNQEYKNVQSILNKNILDINIGNEYKFKFNLNALINDLRKQGVKTITKENADQLTLNQTSPDQKVKVKIIIEQLNGNIVKEGVNKCKSLKYILMFDFKD